MEVLCCLRRREIASQSAHLRWKRLASSLAHPCIATPHDSHPFSPLLKSLSFSCIVHLPSSHYSMQHAFLHPSMPAHRLRRPDKAWERGFGLEEAQRRRPKLIMQSTDGVDACIENWKWQFPVREEKPNPRGAHGLRTDSLVDCGCCLRKRLGTRCEQWRVS
ncbi:hypothetical protein SAICODRAFT_113410 [Saitoella complicata NRRL Y-17804]|uniref:uncharacterized protein n=1 Tax=Saitoella complicata (strain BCRC 22490 / CBS 7301 / JCM 7358 / NBRC 10748 / NRRL Y-17804) TaxID=698492 RepID=UPI0008670DFE|nr:uncharacterized protein SAICODRAFT_113410 [Saitoella complicata NRRL Y-17804]ODQ53373.1 hypothetical protein SAICODRAFT_113410 [Saitoella complicata NRRL Y-17804]